MFAIYQPAFREFRKVYPIRSPGKEEGCGRSARAVETEYFAIMMHRPMHALIAVQ